MVRVTIDGVERECPPGARLLDVLRANGTDLPTLCDDPRLEASGGCRLCLVEVEGRAQPVASCATPVHDGLRVSTRTPALEEGRRMTLRLLAWRYPADALAQAPDKPFHRAIRAYGLEAELRGERDASLLDDSHPYLHVDMSQCIRCYRCVRICDDVQGQFVWRAWLRGQDTQVVAGFGEGLRASDCVACGACADTCPTGAIEDKSVVALGAPTGWTQTTCPYCGVGCAMDVGTRDGAIVTIRPSHESPANRGHLCSKGRYAYGFLGAADRAKHPMLRGADGWRRVTWDEAIAHVASRLSAIVERDGPSGVAVLGSARATNEENYVAQKFARVALGTNNVDCCARVCHAPSAAGLGAMLGTGAATSSYDDIELARTLLVSGSNATHAHPVVGARIKQAARRGAKLVVVDPRRVELARSADVHLPLHPGTNVALFNAMAHVVLAEGLADASFLASRADGLEEFRSFIAEWTPERAAGICGVDAEDIRRAARLVATEKPALFFHGLGLTEQARGTESVEAAVNLALLTGNLGKPGAGVNPLRGQNNVQGSAHMGCEPSKLTGYVPLEKGRAGFERVWGAPVPEARGLDLMEMMDAARAGRLKALWAIGYDVLLTNPNANETRKALGALELLVVQDIFFNETARELATVFLPASASYEKDGTFMNGERRVQRVRRVREPPGEARTDWEIVCDVARAMGRGEGFAFGSAEEIWDEVRAVWGAGAGMAWERLDDAGLQWPCPDVSHPGTSLLHADSFPMGPRATLRPLPFVASEETADPEHPFVLVTGRHLYQFNAGTMTGRTPHVQLRATDVLEISPQDAARLGLRTGDRVRVRSRWGETELPLEVDDEIRPGELFTTFHTPGSFVNLVTGPHRDPVTHTPEYKRTAVAIERVAG